MTSDNESSVDFGQPIYSYTRKQAIADGVLANLSDNEILRGHWRYPVAITSAVWSTIENVIPISGLHFLCRMMGNAALRWRTRGRCG